MGKFRLPALVQPLRYMEGPAVVRVMPELKRSGRLAVSKVSTLWGRLLDEERHARLTNLDWTIFNSVVNTYLIFI